MATSYEILETLDKHANLIETTLNYEEKHQFINLLSDIEQANDEKNREDAVDELDVFCRRFLVIDELLKKLDGVSHGDNRGKPNFDVSKDETIRLFANRLIKATEKSLPQNAATKEKKFYGDN
ncbi:MAG: hypothetical protein JXI43_14590 [Tissierellales bacterium]|nr:hypothetical protein [Tissierellales bacterium]